MGELKDKHLKIADMYFKREYFKNGKYPVKLLNLPRACRLVPYYHKRYSGKALNLPFGVVPIDYGSSDKKLEKTGNVFFAGNLTSKIRQELKKWLPVPVTHICQTS